MRLLVLISIGIGKTDLNLRDASVYSCWFGHKIQNIINIKKSPVQLKTQNLHWKLLETCLKISRYHSSLIFYFLHHFLLGACNCLEISVKEC